MPAAVLPGYVGTEVCGKCHLEQYRSYKKVAMSRSLYQPTEESVPEFHLAQRAFFHEKSGFHYEMIARNGKFYQRRFILNSRGRPTHDHTEEITYVIGSGEHARSYLRHHSDGRITQLPISWYPREHSWGMSPGYDSAIHQDFSRNVNQGCIFCHTTYPRLIPTLSSVETLFSYDLPLGIDCERCHGPGERHVTLATNNASRDEIHVSIFNPSHASKDIQRALCYQCHFEVGIRFARDRLFRPDQEPFSYRPGEALSRYIVGFDYAPRDRPADEFKIAQQGYRMEQSLCFQRSRGELTCTTCHDPHRVVESEQSVSWYRSRCLQCHRTDNCREPLAKRQQRGNDCTACHMWKRRTQDSVHTVFTDHKVQKIKPNRDFLAPLSEEDPLREVDKDLVLTGVQDLSPIEQKYFLAMAYLQLPPEQLVMSGHQRSKGMALMQEFLTEAKGSESTYAKYLSRAYFTLAESYRSQGHRDLALDAYQRSAGYDRGFVLPYDNIGALLAEMGQAEKAFEGFRASITLNPWDAMGYRNIGSLYAWSGSLDQAVEFFNIAIKIDPENTGAYDYLGNALSEQGKYGEAVAAYDEALSLEPRSTEVYWDCARALEKLGKLGLALEYVRTGLRFAPTNQRGLALLSQLQAKS
jgi:tetratricopeptide (TPR) repeat protein